MISTRQSSDGAGREVETGSYAGVFVCESECVMPSVLNEDCCSGLVLHASVLLFYLSRCAPSLRSAATESKPTAWNKSASETVRR